MRTTWNFFTAGQVTFGGGAVKQLGELAARRGYRRILVVTDPVLVEAGVAQRAIDPLVAAGIEVETFDRSAAEPSLAVVDDAVEHARRAHPDAIVGLGGGSNMDLAKITATVLAHGGGCRDYFGFDQIPGPVTPLICVPTTAGTGSEVSHAAVLTDSDNQIKVSSLSNYLRPTLAVVDPELTWSCPRKVIADSGIDALTHAIEARTATDFDKLEVPAGELCAYEGRYSLGNCLADEAISIIGRNLVRAVTNPEDRAAREAMSLAATMAGMAFSNCGVALVHALEYPVGGALHCSHGAGNGLLLPYVMRFNLPERVPTMARIARLLGAAADDDPDDEAAPKAIEAVETIRAAIGIPARIRDIGGTEEQLAGFAEKSFAIKRLLWVNPRRASLEDLAGIYRDAF